MKKSISFLFVLLILTACGKKDEPTPEVTFTLNISGFRLMTTKSGSLKSQQVDFDSFTHKYPSGSLTFITATGVTYTFNTGSSPIDNFSFTLPVGSYTLSGEGGLPDGYGSSTISFTISSQVITIEETTTEIDVTLTPTCALFLVSDENALIDTAYISAIHHPFYIDTTIRYSYFEPTSGYRAYIVKKDGAILDILTGNLQVGYEYDIIITDAGTTQTLNLNPTFTKVDTITW